MSLFSTTAVTCDRCGHVYPVEAVGSVNADRRPDFREAILENRFQDMTCPECAERFRLEPQFSYLDVGHGQWIAAMPGRQMEDYGSAEIEAKRLFDLSYGAAAPAAAREVGEVLVPRVTFGWPAVREKLLIRELGLDDVAVEMLKLDLVRRMETAPIEPGIELRLVGQEEGRLRLRFLDSQSEAAVADMTVDRSLYDDVVADAEGWREIRAALTGGYFVDMQRTYMGDGTPA